MFSEYSYREFSYASLVVFTPTIRFFNSFRKRLLLLNYDTYNRESFGAVELVLNNHHIYAHFNIPAPKNVKVPPKIKSSSMDEYKACVGW